MLAGPHISHLEDFARAREVLLLLVEAHAERRILERYSHSQIIRLCSSLRRRRLTTCGERVASSCSSYSSCSSWRGERGGFWRPPLGFPFFFVEKRDGGIWLSRSSLGARYASLGFQITN